jgi:hypothetical protein
LIAYEQADYEQAKASMGLYGSGERYGFEGTEDDYLDHSEYDYEDDASMRNDGSLVKYRTFSEFMYLLVKRAMVE